LFKTSDHFNCSKWPQNIKTFKRFKIKSHKTSIFSLILSIFLYYFFDIFQFYICFECSFCSDVHFNWWYTILCIPSPLTHVMYMLYTFLSCIMYLFILMDHLVQWNIEINLNFISCLNLKIKTSIKLFVFVKCHKHTLGWDGEEYFIIHMHICTLFLAQKKHLTSCSFWIASSLEEILSAYRVWTQNGMGR
jgi:hypothetical protein